MKKILFKGCATAIATPFNENGVNLDEFSKFLDAMSHAGAAYKRTIDKIFFCCNDTILDDTLEEYTPSKEGYAFKEWTPTWENKVKAENANADSEIIYTASWTINSYTITFDADGGKFSDNTTTKEVTGNYNTEVKWQILKVCKTATNNS